MNDKQSRKAVSIGLGRHHLPFYLIVGNEEIRWNVWRPKLNASLYVRVAIFIRRTPIHGCRTGLGCVTLHT
jgi:hypothetical protein